MYFAKKHVFKQLPEIWQVRIVKTLINEFFVNIRKVMTMAFCRYCQFTITGLIQFNLKNTISYQKYY